jgi:hypothetical protein
MKGHATVRLSDGTICEAEIHGYEAHGIGKKEFKFKGRSPTKRAKASRKRTTTAPVTSESGLEHSSFAICVRNDEYQASLELRKLYPVFEDPFGAEHGMIRVIDESGEDYLFPNEYFVPVQLPQTVEKPPKDRVVPQPDSALHLTRTRDSPVASAILVRVRLRAGELGSVRRT